MLACLEEALRYVLCLEISGEECRMMEENICAFIREDAASYSREELLEKFNTPDQSVALFLEYLKTWGNVASDEDRILH